MLPPPLEKQDPTDDDLVCAMAAGDARALGELYRRHAPFLRAMGTRRLGDPAEAEEVVHDVFIEAWRAASTYDPARGPVRGWLATRMRCRSLDRCARAWRARTGPFGHQEPPDPRVVCPDARRVRAALAGLPVAQQRVLALAHFEGLSCSAIARSEGIPVGTVKSRMGAGLAGLRRGLQVGA